MHSDKEWRRSSCERASRKQADSFSTLGECSPKARYAPDVHRSQSAFCVSIRLGNSKHIEHLLRVTGERENGGQTEFSDSEKKGRGTTEVERGDAEWRRKTSRYGSTTMMKVPLAPAWAGRQREPQCSLFTVEPFEAEGMYHLLAARPSCYL